MAQTFVIGPCDDEGGGFKSPLLILPNFVVDDPIALVELEGSADVLLGTMGFAAANSFDADAFAFVASFLCSSRARS